MSKFPKKYLNKYTLGDSIRVMDRIPDSCVHLLFTSIPDISQMSTEANAEEYKKFIHTVITEAKRIVKPDGFVVFSQQDRKHKGIIIAKHVQFISEMAHSDVWELKDEKIIIKDGLDKGSPMFQFTYQYFSVFTKTGKFVRKGEFLKDIIVDRQQKVNGQKVWSIPFCKMVIRALTKPKQIVIDPFAGAGPVLYAAKQCNRQYWGGEIDPAVYNKDFAHFKGKLFDL